MEKCLGYVMFLLSTLFLLLNIAITGLCLKFKLIKL